MRIPLLVAAVMAVIALNSCKLMPKEKAEKKEDTFVVKSPDWIKQSNIYEVNIRQYTPEGTFKAFEASLPRLKTMGVDILWLMPVTPISKKDRKEKLGSYYAVADYKAINPEYGTMDDFQHLVSTAHQQGFKVIIDWVANHTGADHPWLTSHPDFYNKDSAGNAKYVFDWTDTRDLNYDNKEMRDSMIAAMKFWLNTTAIDGFRCDVAEEVPVDFWKDCITQLKKVRQIFMLAEGDKGALHKAGFDASYPWDMFQTMKKVAAGQTNVLALDSVLTRQDSTFPAGAVRMYFTSNHDENSWNKSDFGTFPGAVHAPFAVLTQTMRASVPLIYSGQEEPILRTIPFFVKDTMEFKQYKRAPFYTTLLTLRKQNKALSTDADFKRVNVGNDKALYAYVRQKDSSKVLVILNLSNKEQKITVTDESLTGNLYNVFMYTKEPLKLNQPFNIEPWGYIIYDYNR
ncbi:MAG: alpha-amylase family glycosyl hydrolase [Chitinophagaceae bacterium]